MKEVTEVTAQDVTAKISNWMADPNRVGMLLALNRIGAVLYQGTVSAQKRAKRRAANKAARRARRWNR